MQSRFVAAPIVMVAIDLIEGGWMLDDALRGATERILRTLPGARLACVHVLRQNRLAVNYALDEQGRNIHVQRLVELKEWARPLGSIADKATFHVLQYADPAGALLDYARVNKADQIVMGARAGSTLRRLLGSVSAKVVAEAPCTVTIVRLPESDAAALQPDDSQG
jgi:nucleotide-binding universal stress UspA family protein